MTTWLVSRHPGAIQWIKQQGFRLDRRVVHLDVNEVNSGDQVFGTLPIQLAAEICQRGAEYWHLTLPLPPELRGQELTAEDLSNLGAYLQAFEVYAKNPEN